MIHITTVEELDEVMRNNDIFLLDFFAEWCGPCKKIGAYFKDLEEEFSLTIVKVNIDEADDELRDRYEFRTIPHILLYKNSEIVYKGDSSYEKLYEALKKAHAD